jgi:hypothetical protein
LTSNHFINIWITESPLKPSGHMYITRLHIWKPQIPCREHICKLHSITTKQCHNLPTQQLLIGFITKVKCAYCAVRTKSSSIIQVKFDRRSVAGSLCSQHRSTKVTTMQLTKTLYFVRYN